MNKRKLKQLFELVRSEPAPVPREDFVADVLRAVHRGPPVTAPEALAISDQLIRLFPRLVFAAALVIVLCVAVDFGLTAAGMPGLGDGLSQISAQWLLTPDEFRL
ncbi:MAG: hypothetical protein ABSB84_11625 [Verrucomicrobiota bacterium]|jgi:hypothetical protein